MGFKILGNSLVSYMEDEGVKNVVIPDGVRTIGYRAFGDCWNTENIVIPDSVTEIKLNAFCDCDNLKDIIIPKSVKIIGENIFHYSNVEHITVYDNIKKVEKNDFRWVSVDRLTIKGRKASITINSRYYNSRVRFSSVLEKTFEFLCADIEKKEKIVFEEIDEFYKKIFLVIYLFFEYGSKKAEEYIYQYSDYIVSLFIEYNEHELLAMLIPYISISEKNIDAFISNAIELKHTEIQLILMHYKNNNFGFSEDNFDDFLL